MCPIYLYFINIPLISGLGIFRLVEPGSINVVVWSPRSSAEVGGATSWPANSGHHAFSCRRIPLSGVPIGRCHPVVHGRHRRPRRGVGSMSTHAPSRSKHLTYYLKKNNLGADLDRRHSVGGALRGSSSAPNQVVRRRRSVTQQLTLYM